MNRPGARARSVPHPGAAKGVVSAAGWRPLLEGGAARRAEESVRAIADDLRGPAGGRTDAHSLPQGSPGIALFFAYRHLAGAGSDDDEFALELLERALGAVSSTVMAPGLHTGFGGVAWVVEHLRGRVLDPDDDAGLRDIDTALCRVVDHLDSADPTARSNYDLIGGLTGLGIYALERLARGEGRELIDRVVDRLDRMAEREGKHCRWFTPPECVPPIQRPQAPEGYYNFGLAHGVPGVLGILGRAAGVGAVSGETRRLLEGGVSWLLAREKPPGSGSLFPTWHGPGMTGWDQARLAWCYGDPGVASGLMCAGMGAGESRWCERAVEVARYAAGIRPLPSERMDASLCHGTAGLGQIFNRFYQITGDARFRDTARHWFEQTLERWVPGTGVGGFRALGPGQDGQIVWQDDPGFLTGSAGVGLALLAALHPIEPEWDRALLLPGLPR